VSFTQCAFYAFDRVHEQGGYLGFCVSEHWAVQHVVHFDGQGVLTHYIPPGKLRAPWHALFGFSGAIVTGDKAARRPMGKWMMFYGQLLLMVLYLAWVAKRAFDCLTRPRPPKSPTP